MLKIKNLYLIWVVLGVAVISAWGQVQSDNNSNVEKELRQHLKKLDRWGIAQLLYTEKVVDEKQKKRAQSTSNPDELALLAEDEDSGVRFYVASNRNVPLDVQLQLVEDPEEIVRSGVALSLAYSLQEGSIQKQLKERIADRLAGDEKPIVRMSLASNRALPNRIYEKLAADKDPIIRQKLAENGRIPRSALAALARDSLAIVRTSAAAHDLLPPSILQELGRDVEPAVRTAVAGNINTPTATLDSLALDVDALVRLAVAQHPRTQPKALALLADDGDLAIQKSVAQHPLAGKELLFALSDAQRDAGVREVARKRLEPILRSEIREDVLERWNTH